jgi:polyhydroxyalkanoate synthesis regulator phasin
MQNGDVIITEDLSQIDVRMNGLDQLIADWNRLLTDADTISNNYEIVRGETKSGTPYSLGQLMDENAGKLFVVLRQKFAISYRKVFEKWILPKLIKSLNGEKIFRITGDNDILDQFREIAVNSWYMKNLVKIGPHTKEQAKEIKEEKLSEMKRIDPTIKNSKDIWKNVKQRLHITITNENTNINDQIQSFTEFLGLEQDPDRRAFLLDTLYINEKYSYPT